MKIKTGKKLGIVAVLVVAMLAMASCGGTVGGSKDDKAKSGSVTIAGSTSVQPLSEAIAEKYMKANEGITIQVQGGGSGQGIKSIESKIADIGALSREVKDEEKENLSKEYKIAIDGIGVVANKEIGQLDLTLNQLKKIYTGEIKDWKEVGGKPGKITVVTREEGSGTRGAFVEITGVLQDDKDMTTKDAIAQPSTGAALETVKKTPNAIGFVSLEAITKDVTAVKIQGVSPTAEAVVDGTYKITRPFMYVVSEKVTAEAQAFIDFVLSDEGQKLVKDAGFIPVK
ncbi:MAG: phosphate ABC transporter substrate-binding protein [Anaerovoracaceae bacterium]